MCLPLLYVLAKLKHAAAIAGVGCSCVLDSAQCSGDLASGRHITLRAAHVQNDYTLSKTSQHIGRMPCL